MAESAVRGIEEYSVNLVVLSEAAEPREFNLQFIRLNLGALINAGEKLHAMIGAMRDQCFTPAGFQGHPFLELMKIPTRRYAKEQVVAQVLAQVFSKNEANHFTRTRHFDLQRFFKDHAVIQAQELEWIADVRRTLDALAEALGDNESVIRNRAIAVTAVLITWHRALHEDKGQLNVFVAFLEEFVLRLRWQAKQLKAGLEIDQEYRYLIDFQRYVTQASVERPAVEARFDLMTTEFEYWRADGRLQGDAAYEARTHRDPSAQSRE